MLRHLQSLHFYRSESKSISSFCHGLFGLYVVLLLLLLLLLLLGRHKSTCLIMQRR